LPFPSRPCRAPRAAHGRRRPCSRYASPRACGRADS
jgi:hypothetical protein